MEKVNSNQCIILDLHLISFKFKENVIMKYFGFYYCGNCFGIQNDF